MAPRTRNRLTDLKIKNAKAPSKISDGGGLTLRTNRDHQKSFVLRYTWQGRQHELGLGGYPRVSLAEARRKAERVRAWLAESPPKNPKDELERERHALANADRDRDAAKVTFGEFATTFIRTRSARWKPSNDRDGWTKTLTKHAAPIWDMPIGEIEVEDILNCLNPIWSSIPTTAERVRNRMEIIMEAAAFEKLRTGPNPASRKGNLEYRLPRSKRKAVSHPSIPYRDIPELWRRLSTLDTVSAEIIKFTILTAARPGEVRGLTWQELDTKNALWSLPGSRMKNGLSHVKPLSSAALEVLAALPRGIGNRLVFPSAITSRAMSDRSLNRQLNKLGFKDQFDKNITIHGMRSSFTDFIGEETDVPSELADFELAHKLPATQAAYRRSTAVDLVVISCRNQHAALSIFPPMLVATWV